MDCELVIYHKKGRLNNQANAQSRFDPNGHTTVHDVPRFYILKEKIQPEEEIEKECLFMDGTFTLRDLKYAKSSDPESLPSPI